MAERLRPFGPALLPHGKTALLLTEVLRSGTDFIDALCEVNEGHPLVSAGRAPCFLGLEMGAQAAAALEAIGRRVGAGVTAPRVGYLVRVREATFLSPDFPAGVPLNVSARLEGSAPPLAIYQISVGAGDVEILRATLSTYCENLKS